MVSSSDSKMHNLTKLDTIQRKIFTIRGSQVLMDEDLAEFYQVDIKRLNEQVKRNIARFPQEFMFQLTKDEFEHLRSQFATTSWGGRRYTPFVFTEQGVSMLSAVLHSKRAIIMSIHIINAFVQMRQFLHTNQDTFKRLNIVETKLLEHDSLFSDIFKKLDNTSGLSKGIFFDGEFFDSYQFITGLVRKAKREIILVDNYVDERTFALFRKTNVPVTIYTKITAQLKVDLEKYNGQYTPITLIPFTKSHDRFLLIDDETYHIGASLKDVGKKWFAFSKLSLTAEIKARLS